MLIDFSPIFSFLWKFKIQPEANEALTWNVFKKVRFLRDWVDQKIYFYKFQIVLHTWINQLLLFPVAIIGYNILKLRGISDVRIVPSINELIIDFIVSELCWEIFYYYIHRLFHTKYLYKNYHKQHHEWSAPYAIVAHYANPIQYVLADLVPPFVGVAVMGSSLFSIYAFTIFGVIESCFHHCGYIVPVLPVVGFHDYHHKKWV